MWPTQRRDGERRVVELTEGSLMFPRPIKLLDQQPNRVPYHEVAALSLSQKKKVAALSCTAVLPGKKAALLVPRNSSRDYLHMSQQIEHIQLKFSCLVEELNRTTPGPNSYL